jgi:hypothetical protein
MEFGDQRYRVYFHLHFFDRGHISVLLHTSWFVLRNDRGDNRDVGSSDCGIGVRERQCLQEQRPDVFPRC